MALQMGKNEKVVVTKTERKTLQLEFSDERGGEKCVLVLTKLPGELLSAIKEVMESKEEREFEFSGENYCGKTFVWSSGPLFTLVFEILSPKPKGFLLLVLKRQLKAFETMLASLPESPYPTD